MFMNLTKSSRVNMQPFHGPSRGYLRWPYLGYEFDFYLAGTGCYVGYIASIQLHQLF